MTNPDLTYIGVLVDRSGSMEDMRTEMEFALDAYLKTQADEPGEARVTLAQFDNVYETVYRWQPIESVPKYRLQPRNATALLDAIAQLVIESGEALSALPEEQRPGTVIIVIITDGHENSSVEYTREAVKEMISRQQSTYSWQFVFLGANIDSVQVAGGLGIDAGSSMDFVAGAVPASMDRLGRFTSARRRGAAAAFTDEDRAVSRGEI